VYIFFLALLFRLNKKVKFRKIDIWLINLNNLDQPKDFLIFSKGKRMKIGVLVPKWYKIQQPSPPKRAIF
jgi:hypothetical protein